MSTRRPCFWTVGLAQRLVCMLAPSVKVSCGRKRARITNTSLNGIGVSKLLAMSVSHFAQALLLSLPARKLRSNSACVLKGSSEMGAHRKASAETGARCLREGSIRRLKVFQGFLRLQLCRRVAWHQRWLTRTVHSLAGNK